MTHVAYRSAGTNYTNY